MHILKVSYYAVHNLIQQSEVFINLWFMTHISWMHHFCWSENYLAAFLKQDEFFSNGSITDYWHASYFRMINKDGDAHLCLSFHKSWVAWAYLKPWLGETIVHDLLSFGKKNISIWNDQIWYLLWGCKQTKCPFFHKMCHKKCFHDPNG